MRSQILSALLAIWSAKCSRWDVVSPVFNFNWYTKGRCRFPRTGLLIRPAIPDTAPSFLTNKDYSSSEDSGVGLGCGIVSSEL